MIKYWMIKSEPSTYSIDDLKRDGFSAWDGVRNYQARNFMRDEMKQGDLALFYHSNANPPGIAGLCRVCRESHPDPSAWNSSSPYFDPKSSPKDPIWVMVEVEYVEKFPNFISLEQLRHSSKLNGLKVLEKGSRLSILPVEPNHFELICTAARAIPFVGV